MNHRGYKCHHNDNGNILNLKRNGVQDWHLAVIPIDDLHYRYDEGNRLKSVRDAEQSHFGYNDRHTNANVDDFEYDDYGNMVKNRDKEIATITYNHLSLPVKITFTGGETIEYTYLADGTKLKKTAKDAQSNTTTTEYRGGFQYKNNILEFFPHSEGYVKNTESVNGHVFNYIFTHTDHLGNIRIKYTRHPQTGEIQILEEDHYYPYGLKHQGYNGGHQVIGIRQPGPDITLIDVTPDVTDTYKYKFNGMEWQDEFDVNVYDFGARNYDPALGRWMNIDPLSEMMRRHSPYNYAFNNPVFFIDPDGMMPAGFGGQLGLTDISIDFDFGNESGGNNSGGGSSGGEDDAINPNNPIQLDTVVIKGKGRGSGLKNTGKITKDGIVVYGDKDAVNDSQASSGIVRGLDRGSGSIDVSDFSNTAGGQKTNRFMKLIRDLIGRLQWYNSVPEGNGRPKAERSSREGENRGSEIDSKEIILKSWYSWKDDGKPAHQHVDKYNSVEKAKSDSIKRVKNVINENKARKLDSIRILY